MASAARASERASVEQPLAAVHRYFEVSLFLLIATGVCTLISTGKLDSLSTILPPAALVWKAYRYWRGHGPEISANAAKWLTIVYFLVFPLDLWFFSRSLAAGAPNQALYAALLAAIHLMLYAMMVRLYSATTTRDYLFLAMLAFSMMLVAAILTVDTAFLVFFFLFLVLSVSTFVGLEIRRSAEGAVAPPLARGTPMAERLMRALGVTSLVVAVGSIVLGGGIFLVLPRVTTGYLSGFNLQPALISGFSDNVELGRIGTIKKSSEVVMRVRLEGGGQLPPSVKWRGVALTDFDGHNWFNPPRSEDTVEADALGWYNVGAGMMLRDVTRMQWEEFRKGNHVPNWIANRRFSRALRYTVFLEPLATDTLFLGTRGMRLRGQFAPAMTRAGRRVGTYLLVDPTGNVKNPYHLYARLLYEAESAVPMYPLEALRNHQIGYSKELVERYLQLPPLDPRIHELALQATRNAPTAYDKAAAIETFLRTRFGYTLELPNPLPADPLAHFLFERRKGHCEYFASAMTIMLRTLGIPARLVNGFLPGEYNDVGEDYIVRASDAHSWVEVYFGEYGWIPFDPTPPSDARDAGFFGRLGLYYDWFQLMWSEWVINYDMAHQMTLAQSLQKAASDWTEQTRTWVRGKHRAVVDWLKGIDLAVFFWNFWPWAIVLAALLSALGMLRKKSLLEYLAAEWGLHFGGAAALSPRIATLQYQKMLHLLAHRGWRKSASQTPREFAASLLSCEFSPPVFELTNLYESARFGDRSTESRRMTELLTAIKDQLKKN